MEREYECGTDQFVAPSGGVFYEPAVRRRDDYGERRDDYGGRREDFRGAEFWRPADWEPRMRATYVAADPRPPPDPLLPPRPGDPGRECGSRAYCAGHRCNAASPNGLVDGRLYSDGCTGGCSGAAAAPISPYGGKRCDGAFCREGMHGGYTPAYNWRAAPDATAAMVLAVVMLFIWIVVIGVIGAVGGYVGGLVAARQCAKNMRPA